MSAYQVKFHLISTLLDLHCTYNYLKELSRGWPCHLVMTRVFQRYFVKAHFAGSSNMQATLENDSLDEYDITHFG